MAEVGPSSAEIGPNLNVFGRFGHRRARIWPKSAEFGHVRRSRPNLSQFGPMSNDFGRARSNSSSAEFGSMAAVGHTWSSSAHIWPISGRKWPISAHNMPTWPKSGHVGVDFGQILWISEQVWNRRPPSGSRFPTPTSRRAAQIAPTLAHIRAKDDLFGMKTRSPGADSDENRSVMNT